jgi:hypothetical protein
MKKNVLSLSIAAWIGGLGVRDMPANADEAGGHLVVVPYFEHLPSPLLHFVVEDQNRIRHFPSKN